MTKKKENASPAPSGKNEGAAADPRPAEIRAGSPWREGVGPAEFVRRLLGRGAVARVRGPLKRVKSQGTPARIAWMRDAAIKGALQWFIRQGGWRIRGVPAGGKRREGRAWALGIWEALRWEHSPASIDLLLRAAEWAAAAGPPLPSPQEVRDLAPKTTADIVLFHMVVDALLERGHAAPDPEDETISEDETPKAEAKKKPAKKDEPEAKKASAKKKAEAPAKDAAAKEAPKPKTQPLADRRRALLGISPLTALFRADELEPEAGPEDKVFTTLSAAAATRFSTLVTLEKKGSDRAILLTYLEDAIAARWIEREQVRRTIPIPEAQARYVSFAAGLEGFANAAVLAQRPDALRPVMRFFERLVLKFGQREAVLRDCRERSLSLVRASDRARFLAQIARVYGTVKPLEEEAERVLGLPFVERSEEDKVFVADYQDRVRPLRSELEAIRRELGSEMG